MKYWFFLVASSWYNDDDPKTINLPDVGMLWGDSHARK